MPDTVTVVDHPLVQHKLGLMREKDTNAALFRQLLREIALLLTFEVTRDLPVGEAVIDTPFARTTVPRLDGESVALISIMRAGAGLAEGMLDLLPSARVGHIGLYRHPETFEAVEYYFKVPEDLGKRVVIVVDPMLATGNSSIAAISRLKGAGAKAMKFVCLLAAPEGVAALTGAHPDVPVFTAAIDERLNDKAYIIPGLGDAGDRLYGTV